MDIAEFLTAQYDEDEDSARDLLRGHPGPWRVDEPSSVRDSGGQVVVADEYHWTPMQHIARHDPARVLADIAAKRRTLERHRECGSGHGYCDAPEDYTGPGNSYLVELGRCADLCEAAAPYADRPGFDPAWQVDQTT